MSLRRWAPQPGPQLAAIDAHWCEELFFGGARGGGKSDYLIGDYLMDAAHYGAEWRGILFRRTYPELEEIVARSKVIIPATFPGSVWRESDKTWTLPTEATLRLRYIERDDDSGRYQGHQYTWIGWDELTNWASPAAYKAIMATLRNGARPVPNKRVRSSGNPGGPGHQWVKGRFVDHAPGGYVPILDPETGMRRMFIPSRVGDNAILLAHDPGYVARLRGVGSAELVRAWLEGDWSVVAGAFFDCWSNDRHTIPPFTIPEDWTRFRAMDWGSAKPFCCYWFAVVPDDTEHAPTGRILPRGCLVVYREYYGMRPGEPNVGIKAPAEEVGAEISRLERGEKVAYGVLDPAAFASDGGPSIAERIKKGGGPSFRPADNKRLGKAGAMGGWDQLRSRLIGDADGRPMIVFFDTCTHGIRTIPALQHDSAKPEDVDTEAEDHCFSGDTLVSTEKGVYSLANLVGTHGKVRSSDGAWHDYRSARLVKRGQPIVRLLLSDGSEVRCTPDHKFLTANGWVQACDLTGLEILSLSESGRKSSRANGSIAAVATISAAAAAFIGWCGSALSGRSPQATMCTTGTTTRTTTRSPIWNASRCASTLEAAMARHRRSAAALPCPSRASLPPNGMGVLKAARGIGTMCKALAVRSMRIARISADGAEKSSRRAARGFARTLVALLSGALPAPTTNSGAVTSAGAGSPPIATPSSGRAPLSAAQRPAGARGLVCRKVEPAGREDVYCLTVPETGNFALANGAIVANCADTVRYGCMSRPFSRQTPAKQQPVHEFMADADGVIRSGLTFREIIERKRRKREDA